MIELYDEVAVPNCDLGYQLFDDLASLIREGRPFRVKGVGFLGKVFFGKGIDPQNIYLGGKAGHFRFNLVLSVVQGLIPVFELLNR